jgi:hypothetical protein
MTLAGAVVVLALAACAGGCGPAAAKGPAMAPPPGGGRMAEPEEYPNVRARIRLSSKAPGLDPRADEAEIWLRGRRFRVRDESGRPPSEILGEIHAPRGLGVPARSMEDLMDRNAATRRPKAGATELFGDLATKEGWVYPPHGPRWARPAPDLAPAAEQILAKGVETSLGRTREVTRLGRAGVEVHGVVPVVDDGQTFHNDVTLVLSPPFLLLDQVRDAGNAEHFFVREILSLEEGAVTDADLTPPAG